MIPIAKPTDVGPALARIRESRGVPRQEVAHAVGMWASQYGQYELGAKVPGIASLTRLLAALGWRIEFVPVDQADAERDAA